MKVLALAAIWLILSGGDRAGWLFGLAVVVLVALVPMRWFTSDDYRLQPLQLPLFLGWFLMRSLVAGWDVSRRLLTPSLPMASGENAVPVRLPPGSPQWFLANLVSLMPGTISVEVRSGELLLHCLDVRQDVAASVAEAERRVARLFGLALPAEQAP